jgi:metal-responsive CopG/Arc/MetJ family transcriptional regulator
MNNQTDYERLTIRIPPDLLKRLKKLSKTNVRSVNSEVIRRLTESILLDSSGVNLNKEAIASTAEKISILANKIATTVMDDKFQK